MSGITKAERLRRAELAKIGLKVCGHCHKELPFDCFSRCSQTKDGLTSQCIECRAILLQEWEDAHSEERALYKAKYRSDKRDYIIDLSKKWRANNIEKCIEYRAEYRKNKKDFCNELTKKWHKENPIKNKIYRHNRRALEFNAEGSHTDEDIKNMLIFFDYKCAYTGEPLEDNYHIDHIIPLTKNGTNYIYNLIPSNPFPNLSKHNNDMEIWFRKQSYFSEERLSKIYEWMHINKQESEGIVINESKYIEEITG